MIDIETGILYTKAGKDLFVYDFIIFICHFMHS